MAQHPHLCSFRQAEHAAMCSISFHPTDRHGSPHFSLARANLHIHFQFNGEVVSFFQTHCGCFLVELHRFVFICTSLKSSSLLCCFLRSIFFTATCLPLCFSLAMHTIPVEPSPILMKLSRYSRGSPADRTRCGTALNEHRRCRFRKL